MAGAEAMHILTTAGTYPEMEQKSFFYDWNDDSIIDHTAICVGTGYPLDGPRYYSDLIDQHTTNRKQVTWHLDYFNQSRNSTAIYAFGL